MGGAIRFTRAIAIWTPWKSKRADCSHPQVYACGSEPHRGRRDCEDGEHISHRYVSRYQTARCRRYSARRSGEAGCVGARAREPAPSSPSGQCRSGHARLMFFNSPRRGVPAAPLISVVSPSARCGRWFMLGPRPPVANDRLRHVLIGYARVSKADGSQSLDLQRDALQVEGVAAKSTVVMGEVSSLTHE